MCLTSLSDIPEQGAEIGRHKLQALLRVSVIFTLALAGLFTLQAVVGALPWRLTASLVALPLAFTLLPLAMSPAARRWPVRRVAAAYYWVCLVGIGGTVLAFDGWVSAAWILFAWPVAVGGMTIKPRWALNTALGVIALYALVFLLQALGLYAPLYVFEPALTLHLCISYSLLVVLLVVGLFTTLNLQASEALAAEVLRSKRALEDSNERLTRSSAQLMILVEANPDAILVVRDEQVLMANAEAKALFGLKEGLSAMTAERLERLKAGGGPVTVPRVEGGDRLVEVRRAGIEFDGGPATVVFIRDVTEACALRNDLVGAERLATVGVLASGLAHEINNPLTYLSANLEFSLEILSDGPGAPELAEVQEMLAEALDGAQRVAGLTRDLGAFSRDRIEKASCVPIEEIVRDAMARVEPEAGGVDIEFTAMSRAHVKGNRARLSRVFVSLLRNAIQAQGSGGGRHRVIVSIRDVGDRVQVKIEDNGVGIGDDIRAHVMEPFFSTRGVRSRGLGLWLAHNSVEAHRGTLTLDSALGVGACVTVLLPSSHARRHSVSGPMRTSVTAHSGSVGHRVLVIDDEAPVRRMVCRSISGMHSVTAAASVDEAQALLEGGQHFDVVVSDLMMPGRSGMDLLSWLKRAHPSLATRVIFVTGASQSSREWSAAVRSGQQVVAKPFERATLLAALARTTGTAAPEA